MANNRLYIVDTATGEYCFLAKGFAEGWFTTGELERHLNEFFEKKGEDGKPTDWGCSAGLDGFPTRLVLLDESQFDPSGMADEKRRIVAAIMKGGAKP